MKQVRRRLLAAVVGCGLFLGGATALPAGTLAWGAGAGEDTVLVRAKREGAPAGTLFIVGGGPRSKELMQQFVDLAGGRGKARIAVFGMAGNNARAGEKVAEELRGYGVEAFSLYMDRAEANTDAAVRRLDGVTGIWFIGGLQTRLARALVGTKMAARIRELYEGGVVVGGTSAGAAIMSTPMITGREKRPGGSRPPTDSTASHLTIERDNIQTVEGLSLVVNAVIDQHFVRRKRQNRLVSVVLENPHLLGVGIDESTALIVHPDGSWSVVGESVVVVYDARRGEVTPASAPVLGVAGMVVHLLPAGSRFYPETGRAVLPGGGVD